MLDLVAAGLWHAFTHAPVGYREPAWAELSIGRFKAAALMAETFTAICVQITGSPPATLPRQIEQLVSIATQDVARRKVAAANRQPLRGK